jgi:hypothetical protein
MIFNQQTVWETSRDVSIVPVNKID